MNSFCAHFPNLMFNLTQLGDALILLSFLTSLIVFVPKLWEALFAASVVSAVVSPLFKSIVAIPRPAAVYNPSSFQILGETLVGHNSLPSGHSMTIFTIITVLFIGFMPKNIFQKTGYCMVLIALGLAIALTRVGVGAHHPLDVLLGSLLGVCCGLLGILISQKLRIWFWMHHKKYYPIFIVLLLICASVLIKKILIQPLLVFYLAAASLLFSLYIFVYVYFKK